MKAFFLPLFAFLLGSIPPGMLIARSRGIDLQQSGSGNIGATNVLRTAGKWPAVFTLCGDILKGVLAVLLSKYLGAGILLQGITGLFAVLGHNFSLFLGFRGGKGVATSLGVLLIYAPQTCLITIIIWLMTVYITRYSSLGALVSFGVLPVTIALCDTRGKIPVAVLITLLLFVRHKDNILRLAQGKEQKVGQKI